MIDAIHSLTPIKALSYWRYTRLKRCQLSGAFPSSTGSKFVQKPVGGRAQELGIIFHSLMEAFHEFCVGDERESYKFREKFNSVLEKYSETNARSPQFRQMGDPRTWPEITEIYRTLSDLVKQQHQVPLQMKPIIHTEKTLYSKDGLLFGQIDAFFVHLDGIDLVDYKSGVILENDSPKEDYSNQLYFYAYLIWENFGIYPKKLTLTGKDNESVELAPSLEKSKGIASDMRATLDVYNTKVSNSSLIQSFSSPKSENCIYCDAKPVCESFWKEINSIEFPKWNHVLLGTQVGPFIRSRSGVITVQINVEKGSLKSTTVKVTKIFEARHSSLLDRPGQKILFTNLKKSSETSEDIAEMTDRTQIHLLENIK